MFFNKCDTYDYVYFLIIRLFSSVLLFPPVNSYQRLLIHQTSQRYIGLHSFSVGEGEGRRTVVCHQNNLIGETDYKELMSSTRPSSSRGRGRGKFKDNSPTPSYHQSNQHVQVIQPEEKKSENQIQRSQEKQKLIRDPVKQSRTRNKKPEIQVYVPKGRRLLQEQQQHEQQQQRDQGGGDDGGESSNVEDKNLSKISVDMGTYKNPPHTGETCEEEADDNGMVQEIDLDDIEIHSQEDVSVDKTSSLFNESKNSTEKQSEYVDSISIEGSDDENEYALCSEELDHKTHDNSKSESRTKGVNKVDSSDFGDKEININRHEDEYVTRWSSESSEEEDEDSWDKMFDEDGECLDPKSLEELTNKVGKVKIKKATIDYYNYQPKDPQGKGFDIKWVDDTHALAVFASAIAAKDALKMTHPLLKVRCLSESARQCKVKARKCTEFLQPYKPRPETSAVTARRLVTGALGLAPKLSKEQREKERKVLKEAREKKKQDRKQRDDIWEGNYKSDKSMDT
ncbi:hypothetical protein KUTeg_005615 [Tegillarca granosa]|uniref:R3H domain-containing protein n=1 Tax=Tegillarca granosa TaxID=220873 RepID=A0ABQ9FNH4_TEGGR|nr:hypothetical protein KUTeg_005615 [Tegillarca granosa]